MCNSFFPKLYALVFLFGGFAFGNIYTDAGGPCKVETAKYEWHDASRDRVVPVKIYYPADCNEPSPVIIFSHGLGGSRDGYEYLGRHWASNGFVSVHVQHKGSDSEILKNAGAKFMEVMKKAAADPRNAIERPKDISFAIDQVEKLNEEPGPFKGHLNLKAIGVAGHSFGAYTTLAVAGQQVGGFLFHYDFTDSRVKAVIPMSAPAGKKQVRTKAYDKIKIPCMHMTGTLDESPIGGTAIQDRRIPFDNTEASEQYLITFKGGDHMIFSGRLNRNGSINDEHFQKLIKPATTAFWDAYLRNDQSAAAWLHNGDLKQLMGTDAAVEMK